MRMQDTAIELWSDASAVTRRSIYKSSFERPAIKSIFCIINEKILGAYHRALNKKVVLKELCSSQNVALYAFGLRITFKSLSISLDGH